MLRPCITLESLCISLLVYTSLIFIPGRITEWLRLERNSRGPTPLFKQSHQEQVALDHVRRAFEYLQGLRFYNLPGQPAPGLSHLHSKKIFLYVQTEPPVFQVFPITTSVTGHYQAWLSLLYTFPSHICTHR